MSLVFLGLNNWAYGMATFRNGNNHEKNIFVWGKVRDGKDQKSSLAQIEFEMLVRHMSGKVTKVCSAEESLR